MTSAGAHVELLAPAGDARALRAALSAGADAVYFGLDRWSARAFAANFAGVAAVRAVESAHLYDARAYLALNTLLKDDEVGPALTALQAPYQAGLDALIVADLGFAARVREAYPDLPLHASTQLNTHSSAQLAALSRLGFRRAILARELSLSEIDGLESHGVELEAFVHGALCYGYSGDCLLSSMVGGRSGNRGRCSQACRLRYRLKPAAEAAGDSSIEPDEDAFTRVISTADLAAIGALPGLLAAGVTAFKIEGRMKDAAYVGVTTAVYREALDAALADADGYRVRPDWTARLEQSFSRGFTTAHLEGAHNAVRGGGRGGHRGVLVGRVARVDEERGDVEIRLGRPVSAGDLVYLYTVWGQTEPVRVDAGGETRLTLRLRERVAVKDRLFRLAAAETDELAAGLVAGRVALRPLWLDMRLEGRQGGRPTLTVAAGDERGVSVTAFSSLAAARTAELTEARASEALGALGGTPYRLAHLEFAVEPGLFLAVGDLKDLRRRALAALDERRLAARRRAAGHGARVAGARSPGAAARVRATTASPPSLVLRLRAGERPLDAPGVDALCLDLATTSSLEAVARAAEALGETGLPVRVRLPEIVFDADQPRVRDVVALPWEAVYVRQLGQLVALAAARGEVAGDVPPWIIESPLQGLNGLTAGVAAVLAGRPPAAVVLSPECALDEIAGSRAALAAGPPRHEPPPALEALAFGRQQVLRTRDQMGRAEGLYDAPGLGESVHLLLEDAKGYEFPAEVDAQGTQLYNARVTNLAASLERLRSAGVTTMIVVQADLDVEERRAFASGGLPALAPLASRERSTTGHLYRGVV